MSRGSKKGFRAHRIIDSNTKQLRNITVPIDGSLDRRILRGKRKAEKANRLAFRAFKDQLREAKKSIPIEQRGDVNWAEVQNA